ncbi:MAG: hypothetical protein WBP61_18035 [Nocardioides sp.]
MRAVAAPAGLLGGLCWIVAAAVEVDALTWAGAVLLALAVLAAGAGLVSSSVLWLRVIVAVCFLALVGSVLQIVRDGGDPLLVDAAAGAVAVVVAVLVLIRGRRRRGSSSGSYAGSHARPPARSHARAHAGSHAR